jgi:hypothetical protein
MMGLILIAAGLAMAVLWARGGGIVAWTATVCVLVSGLFGIYEWRKGWCALRAMGVKIPW